MQQSDFVPVCELAALLGIAPKTIYNSHAAGSGPLSEILTKLGGRLGCWRSDYTVWRNRQRKLSDAA